MTYYANKTIWIIGGTSGIGFSIAKDLAKIEATKIIVSGRNLKKAEALSSSNVHKVELDVGSRDSFQSAFNRVLNVSSHIDIIIFCAGTYEPMSLKNFDAQSAAKILNTNFSSMINFIEIVIPSIMEKCSTICIIGSVAGYFGMPNSLFYGASKAGITNLTESLYYELKPRGIDVKLISPGFVKTPLTEKNSFKMPFIITSEEASKIILKHLPGKRFEIAFPTIFIFIMKFIKLLPFKLRSKILFKSLN
jgi:short-subunit dehydrogenase